jgi:hypothetical protein
MLMYVSVVHATKIISNVEVAASKVFGMQIYSSANKWQQKRTEEQTSCYKTLDWKRSRNIHFVNSSRMVSMLSSVSTLKTILLKYMNCFYGKVKG